MILRFIKFFAVILLCAANSAAYAQGKPLAEDLAAEDDRGFIAGLLEDALGGEGRIVRVEGFEGALSRTATISRLTIADETGVWFTLENLQLRWNRSALLKGQIDVEQLSATSMNIARKPLPVDDPIAAEAGGFALPNLPVAVSIDQLTVDSISLADTILGEAAELSLNATAQLADGSGSIALNATRIDGNEGRFIIDASYDEANSQASIQIDLTEAEDGIAARLLNLPGRPDLKLQVLGNGNIDDLVTEISLETEGIQRLDGEVTLKGSSTEGRAFDVDLEGDLTALLPPEYHSFFGKTSTLRASGERRVSGAVVLSDLDLKTNALSLQGSAALDAQNAPRKLSLVGEIAPASGGSVVLPFGEGELTIARADLGVNYDAEVSDTVTLALAIENLENAAIYVRESELKLIGSLDAALGRANTALVAQVAFQAIGAQFDDAGLQDALGDEIKADMLIERAQTGELSVRDITVKGTQYALTGALEIDGVEDAFQTEIDVQLAATELSRFSTLAGRDLSGQADLAISGQADLGGAFNLTLDGTTTDLGVGIAQADQALAGLTQLKLLVVRDENGTQLPALEISNKQLNATGSARLRTDDSDAQFDLRILDSTLIDPRLNGPVTLVGEAQQDDLGWRVDTTLSGPFNATTTLNGRVTGENPALRFAVQLPNIQPLVPQFSGAASLSGTASRSGEVWSVSSDLAGPYGITGSLSGTATGDSPTLSYQLRIPNVASLGAQLDGALAVDGRAAQVGSAWQIDTTLSGLSGTRAQVSGRVLQSGNLDLTAQGTAPLALANPFIAPRNIQGRASFDLAIQGRPALNSITGTISADSARLSAPTLRNSLTGITATIALSRGRAQIDANAAVSSGGCLRLGGSVVLSNALNADLVISLDAVRISDPALYDTQIDGRLTLRGPLTGGGIISGQLAVGETNIRVPESQVGGFTIIPTIAHRNPDPGVRQTLARAGLNTNGTTTASDSGSAASFALDVRVSAPSRIFVRGRGLDAELGGQLRLTGTTDQIVSSGSFSLIRGRVDILTKRFVLDEGKIALQGDFDPFIRFVATTRTSNGTASIIIEGPASNPDVRFTSVPDSPQDEVLAQIFFGRDVSTLSAFQALQLASAVATLAGTGGEGIVSNLRRGFGLDDLDITTDDDGNTGLRLGKYLNENIYTDVTVGSDSTAGVSINIDISPAVTARGQVNSDGTSSVGIYYEKDY